MARLFAVALLLFTFNAFAETRDANEYFFNEKFGDLKAELANAKKEGKTGILLMYTQADCPWCYRMETTILNQSEVQDYYRKHFLIFHIDIKGDTSLVDFKGKDTTEKAFSEEYRVRATPVFGFYDLDGNPITRLTGVTKDAAEFLLFGKYVVEGEYRNGPFVKYKLQKESK
jgi:thioredoxin-related protein